MAKNSEELSLNKTVKMYGVEVKRKPFGKYLELLQTLRDLPKDFIEKMGIGEDFKFSEIFRLDNLIVFITNALLVLPDFAIPFLSKLLEIDEEKLMNELTLKEVLEIIKKFWELNELESFFEQMKPIVAKIKTLIGFSELSQSASKLE